jgi:Ca-activated chloride channel family protein
MTRFTLLAITMTSLLGSCFDGDDPSATVDGATPRPLKHDSTASAPLGIRQLPVQVEGQLGERMLPVKLPAVTSEKTAVAFRFGRENEHQAWLAQLPEHVQLVSVAYGDGKIFVGGGFSSNTMYALDAKTGKRLWASENLSDPGPTAPVFEDNEIAFNTFSCSMEVLDATTGKTMWTKWIGSETPNQPAITGNLVIAPHPSDGGYQLSAYQKKTGKDVWSSQIDNHILSAPVVHDGSVYVSTTSGSLYRIGLDGKRAWRQAIGAVSAPWIDGNEVHVAVRSGSNEAQMVLAVNDGHKVRTAPASKSAHDAPSEDVQAVWSYEGSRPVVVEGVRYVATGDHVEARDAHTDELRWTRNDAKAEGRKVGSVVVAGPLVVVTSRDGKLVALDRKTGAQRMGFDFGTPVTAQPIIANGWMYVATAKGQILSFDLGNSAIDGWHMWGGNAQHNL